MKLLFLLLLSSLVFGQPAPDTSRFKKLSAIKIDSAVFKKQLDSIQQVYNARDSIIINSVLIDFRLSVYGKLDAGEYEIFLNAVKEYQKQKSIQWKTKPK